MNVTRDVVRDLLTLCAAGDASADSRALVEEHLRRDPALRAEADALEAESRLPAVPPVAAATAEKLALEKTRQLMKTRTSTLAVAVLFTVLPFSFSFSGTGITFLLFRDAPAIAAAWWSTAAVMWAWHAWVRRRLSVAGV